MEYLLTYIPNIRTAETVIATYFRALRMAMLGLKINARFGAKLPGKQNVSLFQDFKGEKTNSSYPSHGRLGVILILTPTAALLVQAATSYPSETLLASFTPPQTGSAAHLSPQEIGYFSLCFAFSYTRLCKHVLSASRQAPGWYQENVPLYP